MQHSALRASIRARSEARTRMSTRIRPPRGHTVVRRLPRPEAAACRRLRRDVRPGDGPSALPAAARPARQSAPGRARRPGRGARPGARRPGHHLLACPARSGRSRSTWSPGSSTRRVGPARARASRSGSGRSRRSWPTSTATGRSSPTAWCPGAWSPRCDHFHRQAVRHRAAQRRARPRRRRRPRPRRGRRVPGAGGQPAHPVRRVVRDREPAGDGARCSPTCSPSTGSARSTTTRPACSPRCGRPPRRASPTRASWCSRRASTTPPTSSTRCWPGRWASSWSRAATWSAATTRSTCAPPQGERRGRRGLPAHRRRLPRPAALPARLGARLRRASQRGPRRQRRDRQRDRQRRRRRQARLHLRARHHPVLPRRGAAPPQCGDATALADPTSWQQVLDRLDELVFKPVDGSGGYGIVIGPHADAERADRAARAGPRQPAGLDRPAVGAAVHRRRPRSASGLRPRHVDLRPFAVNDGDDVCACCPAG